MRRANSLQAGKHCSMGRRYGNNVAVSRSIRELAILTKIDATVTKHDQHGADVLDDIKFDHFAGRGIRLWNNGHFIADVNRVKHRIAPKKTPIRLDGRAPP